MIKADEVIALREEKMKRLLALKKCDYFVGKAAYEAAWDPFSFSFFGTLRDAADAIPASFEGLDSDPGVKVQDRRLPPYVRSQLFIALVSEIEDFLKTLVTKVLIEYPGKVGHETVMIDELVRLGYDGAIRYAAEKKLNEILYLTPKKYGERICGFLSMSYEAFRTTWIPFVEMKARRDVGVHNGWRKNDIYVHRVTEVEGLVAESEFLGISNKYFELALEAGAQLINFVSEHCINKFCNVVTG